MADHKRPESMERITTPALAEQFIAEQVAAVRAQVGDKKVLLALSGGVDSSVVAALLIKAVGKQLTCVHVNHGLLRKGAGGGSIPESDGRQFGLCGCSGPFPGQAGRCSRPGDQAEDHWRGVYSCV